MKKIDQPYFYKYKSLDNIERFLDIIVNNRIYVPKYNELNDPMEGYYAFVPTGGPNLISEFIKKVIDTKSQIRILSLTKSYDNFLMWSHYCNGHTGICLKLKVLTKDNPVNIDYSSDIPDLNDISFHNVEKVLSHKSPLWEYEDEVRYLKEATNDDDKFYNIEISDIYIGAKVKKERKELLTKAIKKINPTIKCHKLLIKDLRPTSGLNFNI